MLQSIAAQPQSVELHIYIQTDTALLKVALACLLLCEILIPQTKVLKIVVVVRVRTNHDLLP